MIEDDCQFFGVHMRLSTRCKIWFTLGLFANYFSLKSLGLSLQKSHECALKLTELRNKSLLFDLNYKFINGASLLYINKYILINNNNKDTLVARILRGYNCSIVYHAVEYKFLEKGGKDRIVKEEMHGSLN